MSSKQPQQSHHLQPSKQFFRIGEVSRLTGLEPYVLRYWETEFPQIKPDKARSGQRLYTKHDLEVIVQIKALLYEDGYTIAGAKKKLNGRGERKDLHDAVETAKRELRDLLEILK